MLRQVMIVSIAAGMLLDPLSVAAQYAYPTVSPAPTVSPTPTLTSSAAPMVDEAADFESTVDLDATFVAFAGEKGDKSFETVPRLDLSKPEEKAKHEMYKDWAEKAISQAMQDTDLIKPYEAANVHIVVVNDLKAYLLANAAKYKLAADFVAKLKEKDFKIDSFLLKSTGPDGKVIYILLIDASVFKSFAGVIVAVNRELQNMILSGKEFPTPLDQEIAALEATIKSLEKVLAAMQKMVGDDHTAVKGLKALIAAEKAKLEVLKAKKAAGGATPAPKP